MTRKARHQIIKQNPATDPFSNLFIPHGHSSEWSDVEWDLLDGSLALLTDEEQSKALTRVFAFDDEHTKTLDYADEYDIPAPEAASKVSGMTDAEWTEFIDGIDADNDTLASILPMKAVCTCDGPGSETQKYPSHVVSCPATLGLKPAVKTGPCTCINKKAAYHVYSCPKFVSSYSAKKTCKHARDVFSLDDGLEILASSAFDVTDETMETGNPSFGVYLDTTWQRKVAYGVTTTPGVPTPWAVQPDSRYPSVFLSWPDRGEPAIEVAEACGLFDWMLDRLRGGETVETGCVGGHGRTGTMLACLLAVQGVDPLTAIERVWKTYCPDAIESHKQTAFIVDVYETRHGAEWRKQPGVMKRWSKCMHEYFTPEPVYGMLGSGHGSPKSYYDCM